MSKEKKNGVTVNINAEELDIALEKANRLKDLLQEIHELIRSLGNVNQKVY